MLIDNVEKLKTFYDLENVYLIHNVSLILKDPNQVLIPLTSLSNWMNTYEFEGNYVTQIL